MKNEELNDIIVVIIGRRTGKAINMLENYLLTHPRQTDMDTLTAIRSDYLLMTEYWQRGFDDPERQKVNDRLLRSLYVLSMNIYSHWRLDNSPYLKAVHLRPRRIRKDWSMTAVRRDLEDFVSNVALLELEPEDNRREREEQTYASHADIMRDLFDYILTSRQWKDSLADTFLDMLLSPTLATIDQQLIVSAITLSTMQAFCFQKFRVLIEVWRRATDQPLRQRALVGWVLNASASTAPLYTEMQTMIADVCQDEECRKELTELQMQLLYCMNAEDDTDMIKNEILPDIISGSNIKVTHKGLVEIDEDTLDDILHPDAAERNMERMEQSINRMADMQKQGADIYFGGFSQMKRFPFFNEVSNWLVPFYSHHPAISKIWTNTRGKKFLKAITRFGAFCDSDKYSFILAFDQVLNRLPQGMLKMIEQGEATPMPLGGEILLDEQSEPAFIRRIYLQNLYRFFKLYPSRSEFTNPFTLDSTATAGALFFANPLFHATGLEEHFLTVAGFLMKRGHYAEAARVLDNLSDERYDFQYFMMAGSVLQHLPETTHTSAAECYRKALELKPGNERALAGYARALFSSQRYNEALQAYRQLMTLQPDSLTYQLNASVCMLNTGDTDEAVKLLYKLHYLQPDSQKVTRVMAWAQTLSGKYDQADKLYCQLLEADKPSAADMLNYGYCLWFAGKVTTAIGMFRQFLDSQTDDNYSMADEFLNTEHLLIADHHISDTEIMLMLDALDS